MAYSYSQGIALNTGDLLVKLRDYLKNTVGWTVVQDTVTTGATGQYCVFSTTGESGSELTNYFRIHRQATGLITLYSYIYWAAGAGNKQNGSTASTSLAGSFIYTGDDVNYIEYWFFGSLDRLVAFTGIGASTSVQRMGAYIGYYTRQRSANRATVTGALTAGNNVVAAVNNTTYFTVGQRYVICDAGGANAQYETPKVTAINPGVSVTLDTLQFSYLSGAVIGEDPRPVVVASGTTAGGLNGVMWLGVPYLRTAPGQYATLVSSALNLSDQSSPERNILGGGGINLWPIFLVDRNILSAGLLGMLPEVYVAPRYDLTTDDTITVGGSTYHYIDTSPGDTASAFPGIAEGLAIRRA